MKPIAPSILAMVALTACSEQPSEKTAASRESAPVDTSSFEAPVPLPRSAFSSLMAAGDAFEIESSRLAVEKARSDELRQFARKMIEVHTTSSADLKAALAGSNITANPVYTREQQTNIRLLRNIPADEFDALYLAMQVNAHQETLKVLQSYPTGTDDALARFVRNTLPVVREHLDHARRLTTG